MKNMKFKIWDKNLKKWATNCCIIPTSPVWSAAYIEQDENINKLINDYRKPLGDIIGGDYTLIDWAAYYELIIVMYTGINDIEGNEIYDGDLLQDKEGLIYEVKFEQGAFKKYLINHGSCGLLSDCTECVVIGNVNEGN